MKAHRFRTRLSLPLPRHRVFAFFADAHNLEQITPPELGFRILTPAPIRLSAGAVIDYRLVLFGVPFRWRTLISVWNPPRSFTDQQTRGPYAEWVHTHQFEATADGTDIHDEVRYRLPFWPIGEILAPLVRLQIGRIFAYRQAAIGRWFAAGAEARGRNGGSNAKSCPE